jgi:hypothetical protein
MEIYTDKDLSIFKESFGAINDKIRKLQLEYFEPNKDEMDKVMDIIIKFVKTNKRKIYGGYALNMMLESKNKEDAIYSDLDAPDIDFYSPDPIVDLMKLCNELHEAGFKGVQGKEAAHKETYSIFVNYQLYCDVSYVPKNIYNRMPFIEIDGWTIIHPHFMTIDFMRMTTDLLNSAWRVEKTLPRIKKLLKHYPLLKIDKPLPNIITNWKPVDKTHSDILLSILTFLKGRDDVVVMGLYAYNIFVDSLKDKKKFKTVNIPYYEFMSDRYRECAMEFIDFLKSTYVSSSNDIKVVEHYPFFQFYGYNVRIYYKDRLIAWIFDTEKRCVPYQQVPAVHYGYKTVQLDGTIRMASFVQIVAVNMMETIYYRTNKENDMVNFHQILTSHFYEIRRLYFEETGKNFMDESVFREYIVECIGSKNNPIRERFELIDKKKKEKSGPYTFKYEPGHMVKEPSTTYRFANSSGNPINNVKNLRLVDKPEQSSEDIEENTSTD